MLPVPSSGACQAVQPAKKQITENRVDEMTCPFSGSELVPWVSCPQTHSGGGASWVSWQEMAVIQGNGQLHTG